MMINVLWEKLTPTQKRWTTISGFVVALFLVITIFSNTSNKDGPTHNRQTIIKHVLTDQNTRNVGIDSLSADLKIVKNENKMLKRELDSLKTELKQKKSSESNHLSHDVKQLRQELDDLTRKNKEYLTQIENNPSSKVSKSGRDSDRKVQKEDTETNSVTDFSETNKNENYKDKSAFFKNAPLPDSTDSSSEGSENEMNASLHIMDYSEKKTSVENESQHENKDESLYLPAGSILTGVLINGMDTPTSEVARRNPVPSTLRIQKEAILPNRFRTDIRECFLIVSGYGDLSSERAYLRGETLSCVKQDGTVIEAKMDSYIVGEDGKVGVRGRLVSKRGQLIARSLMSGFLGGLSDAFDVNPVPVVSTSPGTSTQYQSVYSDDMLQGAAMKGASKALDRVAQFYLDMAENIFPIIEVDAGRQVDVIMTKGMKLKMVSTTSKHKIDQGK